MCRTTDNHHYGFYQNERDKLKIKAFYVQLSISQVQKPLPESFTLLYLPRINEKPLEINDSKIKSDSSAFVTLYRIRSEEEKKKLIMNDEEEVGEVVYGSRERVKASEGVRFEIYSKEEKIMKGIFRKDDEDEWKLDCKCVLESHPVGFRVSEGEVFVAADGNVSMIEKVKMVVRRRRRKIVKVLEEIPEEREEVIERENTEMMETSEGSCDCCCEMETGSSNGDEEEEEEEIEMEGGKWAVDVGIWVMCLGVGYLVSKASSRTLRRKMMLK